MFGIAIAAIIVALSLITGHTIEAGFLSGAGFLWVWYWIWTIVVVVITALLTVGATGFATVVASSNFGQKILAGLGGFAAGAAFSGLLFMGILLKRALLLIGTYLLMTSGTAGMTFVQFNSTKLIVGTIMLLIALFVLKRSRTSSE